ncbi:MAG: response regulator, partial [Thermodesulfobacteriota bacterium]
MKKKYRILIVDDEAEHSANIKDILELNDYAVNTAGNGRDALSLCQKDSYDLAIVDIKLPDISGNTVVSAMAKMSPSTEYIYITGYASVDTAIEAVKQERVISYETKPINMDHLLPIIRQITVRKQAEEELRESEERYRVVFEQAVDSIVVVDADTGEIIEFNDRAHENLGYTREEFKKLELSDIDLMESPEDVRNHIEKVMKEGCDIFETKHRTKKGEIREVLVSAKLLSVPERNLITAIWCDITERKKMEETLLQSEKLRAMGMMTSGVAHDFNNILAVISGNAQLMEGKYKDHKEMMDGVHVIRKAVSDGAEIVKRMRSFTKVERNTSEFVSVDVKEILEQAIDFSRPRWMNIAKARGLSYDIDDEGVKEVPTVLGSPSELREIFVNIINNALDAMTGGGCITFRTWHGSGTLTEEDTVFISISDTGEGMIEEVRKRVFDPFYTTTRAEGSGLGMSVAYGVITGHGGKIEVESEAGKGATFTMSIPITRETPQQAVSPEPLQKVKTRKLHILVVDDEEKICSMLDKYFSRDGHDVKSVNNGTEAIKLLKNEEFVLVLCDLVMPDMSGHDVVKVINELDKRPK